MEKNYLYVAYGIYGDQGRNDNNHQVLLRYDIRKLNEYAGKVKFGDFYGEGPDKPLDEYFAYTGNTNWGVQNLAYDAETGKMFMAVYKGRKSIFKNYDLFVFDVAEKPVKKSLAGVLYDRTKHKVIGSRENPVSAFTSSTVPPVFVQWAAGCTISRNRERVASTATSTH